jgi:hypothetical protein
MGRARGKEGEGWASLRVGLSGLLGRGLEREQAGLQQVLGWVGLLFLLFFLFSFSSQLKTI